MMNELLAKRCAILTISDIAIMSKSKIDSIPHPQFYPKYHALTNSNALLEKTKPYWQNKAKPS